MSDVHDGFIARDIERAVHRINALGSRSSAVPAEAHPLMREALTELSTLVEELETTTEELRLQNEHFVNTRISIEEELDTYRALFTAAPFAYLVTSPEGVIRHANHAAGALFSVSAEELYGKPLAAFVPLANRSYFRRRLLDACSAGFTADSWQMQLSPRNTRGLTVAATCTRALEPGRTELLWTFVRAAESSADAATATSLQLHDSSAPRTVDPSLPDELVIALHHAGSVDGLLDALLRELVPHVCDFCVVDVADNQGGRVRCAVMHSNAECHDAVATLLDEGAAVANSFSPLPSATNAVKPFDESVITQLAARDAERDALRSLHLDAYLCLPMQVGARTFGSLSFGWMDAGPSGAEDIRILQRASICAGELLDAAIDAEARERATDAVTASLLSLAHDLLPPLHAIDGQADVIEEQNSADEVSIRHALHAIRTAGHHLTDMVYDVLAAARADSQWAPHTADEVDAGDVLRAVSLMLGPAAAAHGVVIEVAVRETKNLLRTDASRVRRLLINVINQAISDVPDSQLRITVKPERDGVAFTFVSIPTGSSGSVLSSATHLLTQDAAHDITDTIGPVVLRQLLGLIGGELSSDIPAGGQSRVTRIWLPGRFSA